MHPTIAQLISAGPVATDGAWGTQLQRLGLPVGACPDAWNITQPEKVEQVARAYVEAGSRVILTNTFGANRFVLARYGLDEQAAEINRAGVEISLRAAKKRGLAPSCAGKTAAINDPARCLSPFFQGREAAVFASIGPSGVMLMMGQVSEADLKAAFAEQVRAIAEAGADGIVIETMSDPSEAALAVAAARETGLPVAACMTFDSGANRDRTMTGATPEQAAEALSAAGADAIGSNCGHGIADMVDVCRRLRAATDRPIWIKANAGLPEIIEGETVYRQTPAEFASYAPRLVEAGASFIGGCCGTTPEFIRAVAEGLRD
ncbi:MAG: homocysteine S-methyltransferase family protein [Planctomycetes bacterium]|nr:homocysteine S-methyltransferase family protein [Planctomycetota bacterium]MBU4398187.1 homocysteine S-methyltransferase family protein [Planctomycetota bacterium]MCG2685681.1 homocysteine S-methyltransferase family protein [Planctomycetales bacterium]